MCGKSLRFWLCNRQECLSVRLRNADSEFTNEDVQEPK